MKPKSIWILALLFTVFSAIAFLPPFEINLGFWAAYVAGLIAIFAQVYFFKKSFREGVSAKSKFYGYPIARIGIIYLLVQIALSIGEMALAGIVAAWVFAIVNVAVLVLAALGCIATEVARDEVVRQDETLRCETNTLRDMQVQVKNISVTCEDEELKRALESLVSDLRFSDPKTSEPTADIEAEIGSGLDELANLVTRGKTDKALLLTRKIQALVAKRNNVCKAAKQ